MRLKAVIKIDLPSYLVYKKRGALAMFFGSRVRPLGETRVLADTFTLIDQFIHGFRGIGITNAIALKIDHRVIYKDTREREDDIGRMISAIDRYRDIIDEEFELLQIAMECRRTGIRYVFDTQVRGTLESAKEGVHIAVSGKIEELDQKDGESHQKHRMRLKTLMADDHFVEGYQLQFKIFLEDIFPKLKMHTNAVGGAVQFLFPGAQRIHAANRSLPSKRRCTYSQPVRVQRKIAKTDINTVHVKRTKKVAVTRSSSRMHSKTVRSEVRIDGFDDCFKGDLTSLNELDDLIKDIGENFLGFEDMFSARTKNRMKKIDHR